MQTTAVFYGRLRDRAGAERRATPLMGPIDLSTFRAQIAGEDAELASDLAAPFIRVAINDEFVPRGEPVLVRPGDEVAFMPPLSGG